ncbi:MAG: hypothetical protein K2I01_04970, partial [Lachnospiraceae bacterium]|nr:hypothetical protein [Lachnospiraceae bacterium]
LEEDGTKEYLCYAGDGQNCELKPFYCANLWEEAVLTFYPKGEKSAYLVTLRVEDGEADTFLLETDFYGNQKILANVDDFYCGDADYGNTWRLQRDWKGNLLLYSDFALWYLDAEGNILSKEVFDQPYSYQLTCLKNGDILIVKNDNEGRQQVYLQEKETGKEKLLSGVASDTISLEFCSETEDSFLVRRDAGLYRYWISDGKEEKIWDWSAYGINGPDIYLMFYTRKGELGCLFRENDNVSSAMWSNEGECEEKEYLKLVCIGKTDFLNGMAADFNRKYPQYLLEITDYGERDEELALNLLYQDILAGNAPDIIAINPEYMDYVELGRKGILEDLQPFMEREGIDIEMVESVYRAILSEGKCYMLPCNFMLDVLSTKEQWLNEEGRLEIRDMLRFSEESPKLYPDSVGREWLLEMLFFSDSYQAWQNGEELRVDKIAEYLVLAGKMPQEAIFNTDEDLYKENKVLFETGSIREVLNYTYYRMLWGEGFACTGYPDVEGNGVVLVMANSMGICTESRHKEAAWRFLVECAEGERACIWSFSTLKPQLEEQFVQAAERWMTVDYDGNDMEIPRSTYEYKGETISVYAASEEEIEAVRRLIDGARVVKRENKDILNILHEEAAAYFAGQKSAEAAAEIIVNRMNLYRNQEMQ